MNPSRRPFVLQILTALLAAVFVMPACMTTALWRDNRSRDSLADVQDEQVQAYWSADGSHLFVQVPAHAAEYFHPGATGGKQAFWLVVTPREHTTSAYMMTALTRPRASSPQDWPRVRLTRTLDGGKVSWELDAWTMSMFDKSVWANLPGWSSGIANPAWRFTAACDVREAASTPRAELEGPVARLGLISETLHGDGTHVVTRVLVTPLALALDTAFSPFELLAFLAWIAR